MSWDPNRTTVGVYPDDLDRLGLAAYLETRGRDVDVRVAMADRVRRALDALEREERADEMDQAARRAR